MSFETSNSVNRLKSWSTSENLQQLPISSPQLHHRSRSIRQQEYLPKSSPHLNYRSKSPLTENFKHHPKASPHLRYITKATVGNGLHHIPETSPPNFRYRSKSPSSDNMGHGQKTAERYRSKSPENFDISYKTDNGQYFTKSQNQLSKSPMADSVSSPHLQAKYPFGENPSQVTKLSAHHQYHPRSSSQENLRLFPKEENSGGGSSRSGTDDTSVDFKHFNRDNINEIFYKSVCKNNLSTALKCIYGGANLEQRYTGNEHTVLHEAALRGYVHMTDFLCREGADPNAVDRRWFLPLHYACQFGHTDVVKVLLSYNSSVMQHNEYGDPPLHTTARYNKISLIPLLLAPPNYHILWVERRKKRILNSLEFEDDPRFHSNNNNNVQKKKTKKKENDWFSKMKFFEKKSLVQDFDEDGEEEQIEHVNLQNSNGDTALHIAVALARKRMVKKLLAFGATAFIRNHQGRTAYDIAQERRDAIIARIIRKNAGLPYPKYWLTPPPDPPKSPVIFLPIEHHGHGGEISEFEEMYRRANSDDDESEQPPDDFVLKRLDVGDEVDSKNIIKRRPNQFQPRSYLEPITPRESSLKIPPPSPSQSQSDDAIVVTDQSKPIPPPPPPPPQPPLPRTSSLSYMLEKTDISTKKRNLTFNLENSQGDLEHKSANCYHHYIQEPTKVIELEPQPNNINKLKWKHRSSVERLNNLIENFDKSTSVEHSNKSSENLEIVTNHDKHHQTNVTESNCLHSCRLCVPNQPPITRYDSSIIGPSTLNLQLNDITDRYRRIDNMSRSVGDQLHHLNSIFPQNLRRHKRESRKKFKSKRSESARKSSSPKKNKEKSESKTKSILKNKVLLLKCKQINGKSDKCTATCSDRGTNTIDVAADDEVDEEIDDFGDEIPLVTRKGSNEESTKTSKSKKFSMDSTKGLDDFRTKSFDEKWFTDEKILVEVHREASEEESSSSDSGSQWSSDKSSRSKASRTRSDYAGSSSWTSDTRHNGLYNSSKDLSYIPNHYNSQLYARPEYEYHGNGCRLNYYQQEQNRRRGNGFNIGQDLLDDISGYRDLGYINEDKKTNQSYSKHLTTNEFEVHSRQEKSDYTSQLQQQTNDRISQLQQQQLQQQTNQRMSLQQQTNDRISQQQLQQTNQRLSQQQQQQTNHRISQQQQQPKPQTTPKQQFQQQFHSQEYKQRQSGPDDRFYNFHKYSSWGQYNRTSSVSRIGRVSPKIRELQDQLRMAQNKPPIP